jgi:aminopeptidase N
LLLYQQPPLRQQRRPQAHPGALVAADDFNAGAMENKGLNIFNSKLILADSLTATDADFFDIESVVAHEYFHNWTGNRITLRNWFQLSLKEGLTVFRDQEFSADMTEKGIQRVLALEYQGGRPADNNRQIFEIQLNIKQNVG